MINVIECVSEPAQLGESPLWHPDEQVLYWCDITGRALHRFDPASGRSERWDFETDVGCCVPAVEGGLILALRSGFWRFDPATGAKTLIDAAPYDPTAERFNDGKADAAGRLWCGTLCDVREQPLAALYCLERGATARKADGITISNGLAWSLDGRTLYWADSMAHLVYALDFAVATGAIDNRRVFAQFDAPKPRFEADRQQTQTGDLEPSPSNTPARASVAQRRCKKHQQQRTNRARTSTVTATLHVSAQQTTGQPAIIQA